MELPSPGTRGPATDKAKKKKEKRKSKRKKSKRRKKEEDAEDADLDALDNKGRKKDGFGGRRLSRRPLRY